MTDELAEEIRRRDATTLLIPLFFVSGMTALVYQDVWARELHRVFGTSQFAIATVLAAFMAGLAMGGFAAARVADTLARPLRAYGILEMVIGAWALIFPLLLDAATPIYLLFHRLLSPSPVVFGVAQFVLVAVLLLVPTTCMGATLPLLGRFVTLRMGQAGDRIGLLYGVNTFGAVVGVAIAGFWLLPALGLKLTTFGAAAGNLLLGLGALSLSRSYGEKEVPVVLHEKEEAKADLRPVLAVAVLTGFAALVDEVAWFRLMSLVLGASTYAFSVMLLAFLIGIAAGGRFGGKWADRLQVPLMGLALAQVGIAVLTWGAMYMAEQLPFSFVWLYAQSKEWGVSIWPLKVLLAAAVMCPPALLMGASFPLMVRAAVGKDDALGGPVGRIYGANTLGSLVGAFLAGFVLLPQANVLGAIMVACGANLAAALVAYTGAMAATGGINRLRQAGALVGALVASFVAALFPPSWDPLLMTSGVYKYVSEMSELTSEGLLRYAVNDYHLLFYDEGLSSVVTVAQSRGTGNIWLANNGKVDASTTIDMPTQVLVSHLPLLFAGDKNEEVLVIGLASGITLGAVTQHLGPKVIDVVELEPAIIEASHFFDDFNHRPLDDPRVRVFANDGRNHLLLAPEGSYDVIVSEPSNPWLTGVSNLFTREFFEMGKARLKPGGVWGQWVQLYGMDPQDLRSLLGTFCAVFPHVQLFATIEDADLVLVGSDRPLDLRADAITRLLAQNPGVAAEMNQIGVHDAYDLMVHWQMGRDELLALAGDVELNTDDNMRIEFSAPLHLHESTAAKNLEILLPAAQTAPTVGVEDALGLAEAFAREELWGRSYVAAKRAYELDPQTVRAVELMARAERELATP